jgi:hypothetical protein
MKRQYPTSAREGQDNTEREDAEGREKFLKSGSGRRFLRAQLRHYLRVKGFAHAALVVSRPSSYQPRGRSLYAVKSIVSRRPPPSAVAASGVRPRAIARRGA